MSTTERLASWELARLTKRFEDEIYERTTGPFSRTRPCGDPSDLEVLEKGLRILSSHRETSAT